MVQERPTFVCIQETKLSNICNTLANEILETIFAYDYLPAINVSGGILLEWNTDCWTVTEVTKGRFSLSAKLTGTNSPSDSLWITVVYGPQLDRDKVEFLGELLYYWESCPEPWFLCGDFNVIYRAQDKNNSRLDRRCMRLFRSFLNRTHLEEMNLVEREGTPHVGAAGPHVCVT